MTERQETHTPDRQDYDYRSASLAAAASASLANAGNDLVPILVMIDAR
jgi:hypothetical protein